MDTDSQSIINALSQQNKILNQISDDIAEIWKIVEHTALVPAKAPQDGNVLVLSELSGVHPQ